MTEKSSTTMRLQKYLSQSGVSSRRGAEQLIREGKIKVNGKIVTEMGVKVDPKVDRVQVGSKLVKQEHPGVLLFHKPRGVISTLRDPEGRESVADFLTKDYLSYFPVGRLDYESSGLMILTNDGELAERLLHPRYQLPRTYEVKVSGSVTQKTIDKLARGVKLEDGVAKADVRIISSENDHTWLEVTVTEGRNRLIRRILDKVFHPVAKLQRIQHGPVKLNRLKPGAVRRMPEKEYEFLRNRVMNETNAFTKDAAKKEAPATQSKSTQVKPSPDMIEEDFDDDVL